MNRILTCLSPMLLLTAHALYAALPVTGGTAQTVVSLVYTPPYAPVATTAIAIAGSATTALYLAAWKLTDTAVGAALQKSATSGVAVGVVLDLTGGSNTLQHQIARALVSSGGTVWSAKFPNRIENNFLSDGQSYTQQGNATWSPTAVQQGHYTMVVAGTTAAAACKSQYLALVASGTRYTAYDTPAFNPLAPAPQWTRVITPQSHDYQYYGFRAREPQTHGIYNRDRTPRWIFRGMAGQINGSAAGTSTQTLRPPAVGTTAQSCRRRRHLTTNKRAKQPPSTENEQWS